MPWTSRCHCRDLSGRLVPPDPIHRSKRKAVEHVCTLLHTELNKKPNQSRSKITYRCDFRDTMCSMERTRKADATMPKLNLENVVRSLVKSTSHEQTLLHVHATSTKFHIFRTQHLLTDVFRDAWPTNLNKKLFTLSFFPRRDKHVELTLHLLSMSILSFFVRRFA